MKTHYLILIAFLSLSLVTCKSKSEEDTSEEYKKESENKEVAKKKSDAAGADVIPDFDNFSNEKILLRYKFKSGEKISFKLITNMEINMGKLGEIKMNIGMRGHYIVDTVYTDSTILAMMYLSDIVSKTTGMTETSYDSRNENDRSNYQYSELNNMVETNIPVLITPTGELADIESNPHSRALAAASSFYSNQQVQNLIQGSFTQLSEAPVKMGDVYEAGTLNTVASQMKMTFNVSYRIESVSADKTQAILVPIGKIDSETEVDANISGRILFNVAKGNIERSFADMAMKMEIENQKVEFLIKMYYETDM